MSQIKGAALRGARRASRGGEGRRGHVLASSWYPYESYAALLRLVGKGAELNELPREEFLFRAGRMYVAVADLDREELDRELMDA